MVSQPQHLADGKLPVFVFPTSLAFYSDNQSSHKQILTLYNPYDFTLKFKVLSTSPRKYDVSDSEGIVRPRCCTDVLIRYTDISIRNEGARDKFRILLSEHGQKAVVGRRDILSVLLPTQEATPPQDEHFQSLPCIPVDSQHTLANRHDRNSGPSMFVIFIAIFCFILLMLPTQGDMESVLPTYTYLSVNQKLIAAYVLGLVTMVLLRP